MKTFKQFLTEAKFQIIKSRDGSSKGPLPSMRNFTDYSTTYEVNMVWYDYVENVNIIKKHINQLFKYLGYNKKEIETAVKEAKIEKQKRIYFQNEPHDKGEFLPGYMVTIKFDRD